MYDIILCKLIKYCVHAATFSSAGFLTTVMRTIFIEWMLIIVNVYLYALQRTDDERLVLRFGRLVNAEFTNVWPHYSVLSVWQYNCELFDIMVGH